MLDFASVYMELSWGSDSFSTFPTLTNDILFSRTNTVWSVRLVNGSSIWDSDESTNLCGIDKKGLKRQQEGLAASNRYLWKSLLVQEHPTP